MQEDLPPFPYEQQKGEDLLLIEQKDKTHIATHQVDSFRQRFPLLSFVDRRDSEKIAYQGKHTERNRNFLLRFDIKYSQTAYSNTQDLLTSFTTSVVQKSYQSIKKEAKQRKFQQFIKQCTQTSVSQGYLLTGIAKPTASADFIFNTILGKYIQEQEQQIHQDNQSQSNISENEIPKGYSVIKRSWQSKLHSYEYFKFMTRIYRQLRVSMNHERACKQLFLIGECRTFKYFKQDSKQKVQISDRPYFTYFCKLFQLHADKIYSQLINHQNTKSPIKIKISNQTLQLRRINYFKKIEKMFENCEMTKNELESIAESKQKKYAKFIQYFQYQSKEKRLQRIRELSQVGPNYKVQVVAIRESGLAIDQKLDNYLIAITRNHQFYHSNINQETSLSQLINNLRQGQGTIMDANLDLFHRDSIFYLNMFKYIQYLSQKNCPSLIKNMSLHPQDIIFDGHSANCDINLDISLQKTLNLDELILTQEQQMLNMTPGNTMSPYDIFQKLKTDLYPQILDNKWVSERGDKIQNYFNSLCKILGGNGLNFIFRKGQREKVLKQQQSIVNLQGEKRTKLTKQFGGILQAANIVQTDDKYFSHMQGVSAFQQLQDYRNQFYPEVVKDCSKIVQTPQLFHLQILALISIEYTSKDNIFSYLSQHHQLLRPPDNYNPTPSEASKIQKRLTSMRYQTPQEKKMYQISLVIFILTGVIKFIKCSSDKTQILKSFSDFPGISAKNLIKNFFHLLEQYLKHSYKGTIAMLKEGEEKQNRSVGKKLFQEGKYFGMMKQLYNDISSTTWSNHTQEYLKTVVNTAYILHQYRVWLFILQSILTIENNKSKEQKQLQKLKATFQGAYKQFIIQDSTLKLGQDINKKQFEPIFEVLKKAQKIRRVQYFYRKNNDNYLNFNNLVTKMGFLMCNPADKEKRQQLMILFQAKDKSLVEQLSEQEICIQEDIVALFCHLNHHRKIDFLHSKDLKEPSEREKEVKRTTKVLAFFLYDQQHFRKGVLQNMKETLLGVQGWQHYQQLMVQQMLTKIQQFANSKLVI